MLEPCGRPRCSHICAGASSWSVVLLSLLSVPHRAFVPRSAAGCVLIWSTGTSASTHPEGTHKIMKLRNVNYYLYSCGWRPHTVYYYAAIKIFDFVSFKSCFSTWVGAFATGTSPPVWDTRSFGSKWLMNCSNMSFSARRTALEHLERK